MPFGVACKNSQCAPKVNYIGIIILSYVKPKSQLLKLLLVN